MPGESVFMAPEECGMNSNDQDCILMSAEIKIFHARSWQHKDNIIPLS